MSKKILEFLVIVIVIFVVFGRFVFSEHKNANDYPYIYPDLQKQEYALLETWNDKGAEGLGEYSVALGWKWPLDFVYGALGRVGLPFEHTTLVLFMVFYVGIGAYSISKFLDYFKVSPLAKLISAVIYLANSYVVLLIDGGQLSIAFAYALFPLVFFKVVNAIESKLKEKIAAGMLVAALGFLDIRFVFVLGLLLAVRFTYDILISKSHTSLQQWIVAGISISVIVIGLNMFWLLPTLLTKSPTLPPAYTRISEASFFSFASIGHGLLFLQPHWYLNSFGKITPLLAGFVIFPILALLAPIVKPREKEVFFWLIVGAFGIFLVKGSNPPLAQVYPWIFMHIPGFSLFRDPSKFYFLIAISFTALISFTLSYFEIKWKKVYKFGFLMIMVWIAFLLSPLFRGLTTGTTSASYYKEDFLKLNSILLSDKNFSRVVWLPTRATLGYASANKPILEASRIQAYRPLAAGKIGNYDMFNFLREHPLMEQYLDILGVGYLVYPLPDPRKEEIKEDNLEYYRIFNNQIGDKSWVKERLYLEPVNAFSTKAHQDKFFITNSTWAILGGDRIYFDFGKQPGFSLANNAIYFLQEQPRLGVTTKDLPTAGIILYNTPLSEILFTVIPEENFIFPANSLDFEPNEAGWWKRETSDFSWWRAFLQEKYGLDSMEFDFSGGWAIAEGDKRLVIANKLLGKGKNIWIRTLKSPKGGKIIVKQGQVTLKEIVTYEDTKTVKLTLSGSTPLTNEDYFYNDAYYEWVEVGKLVSEDSLVIETSGDLNVINALVVFTDNEKNIYDNLVEYLLENKKVIVWDKNFSEPNLFSEKSTAKVTYEMISPSEYKIHVSELVSPSTLVFSQKYDGLWSLEGQNAKMVYGMLNGFRVEFDGDYRLTFIPQKYVLPGYVLSGSVLIILILLLVILKGKK